MLKKVDRILLRVPALAAAVKYYAETLQLPPIRHDRHLASFKLGDCELVLHNDPDLPGEGVYYLVDNVRELYDGRADNRLTFLTPPIRSTRGWRATVKDPFGLVLLLIDRAADTAANTPGVIEDGKTATTLFPGMKNTVPADRELLAKLYEQIGRTADDLPYTPHFEKLFKDYAAALLASRGESAAVSREEVWRHLLNLRKAGKLPKLGESKSSPPEISDEEKQRLAAMVGDMIGRRDRLPYTARFDMIVDGFNKAQPRPISPHLVWRLVATLGKRSK